MGLGKLFTFGHLVLMLFCHNVKGHAIDEIIQGYTSGYIRNLNVSADNPLRIQSFFEYIDDQINMYPPNQREYLYKQISEHPVFQSAEKKCMASIPPLNACDPHSRYRTYDGSCNNLKHPTRGRVNECVRRYLPAYYEGTHGIRLSVTGRPLPPPRDLTVNICSGAVKPSAKYSFLLVMFAQFVTHDTSLAIQTTGIGTFQCCPPSPNMDERCYPILLRPDDPFYSKYNRSCISFTRADPCKSCSVGKRHPTNNVTVALDVSLVYGKSKAEADRLRAFDGTGSLLEIRTSVGNLLPPNQNPRMLFCPQDRTTSCFITGDLRVNQHTGLMSLTTLFMREHNRCVGILQKINPHWKEERLYQEGRKIVGGQVQAIIYKELLSLLLGPELMDGYGLRVGESPGGTRYNPKVTFGSWVEFTSAAFRIHNIVGSQTGLFNMTFKDLYSNTNIIHSGNMDVLLKGLRETPTAKFNKDFVKDVSGFMYLAPNSSTGQDLPSSDISRGRDHGLAPYKHILEYCFNGNVKVNKFDDLEFIMSPENIQLLKKNYEDVRDIDAWLGMQMEKTLPDGLLGPTSACIVAKQFYALKYGDRFYFEHVGVAPSFTPAQRRALTESTLSRIICANTEICEMQKNSLLLPSPSNPMIPCSSHGTLDLSAWKEKMIKE